MALTDLIDEFSWRGLIHQSTDETALRAHLATKRRVYVGLDPSADSLTIGNLVTLMMLAHAQRCGHEAVVVAGGGTGVVGDPSGKSSERPLLSMETIEANVESQRRIYDALLPEALIVNNAHWLMPLGFLDVLRDVGKYFSVNEMLRRDSVKSRLDGDGMSYTEFSYMLLQAYDFNHLYRTMGVTLQMGGSDQWGNIVSGIDLIRRTSDGQAFALTCPLITKADGGKFGKSESGAIWLTADRTSPYAFHQFWLNTSDADVIGFLRIFTFLGRVEIESLASEVATNPGGRVAQLTLADDVTARLHGTEATSRAKAAAKALFTGDVAGLDESTIREVFADVPSARFTKQQLHNGIDLVSVLTDSGLAKSKREAREFIGNGSVLINGNKATDEGPITADMLLHGNTMLLRRGKKSWCVTTWEDV